MRVDVLTLFPAMFAGPLDESIVRRARDGGVLDLRIHDLRNWTHDRHKTVDDRPFGGGPGMVLKPEPLFEAVESLRGEGGKVILTSPSGRVFTQEVARELSRETQVVIVCGSYEGFDERIREHLADDDLSIGDYVLTNGALPAMVIIDSVARLLPGALGDDKSSEDESFSDGLLEYPHYTRPAEFRGWGVPDVLMSGNHAEIERWRRQQAVRRTAARPHEWAMSVAFDDHGEMVPRRGTTNSRVPLASAAFWPRPSSSRRSSAACSVAFSACPDSVKCHQPLPAIRMEGCSAASWEFCLSSRKEERAGPPRNLRIGIFDAPLTRGSRRELVKPDYTGSPCPALPEPPESGRKNRP